MSTTTTTQTTSLSILADYELHHSGTENQESTESVSPSASASESHPQPQPLNWPSNHRRVPAYRPINRNLNLDERPAGSNPADFVFIQTMLHGVWLNASVARLWRFTGGRINDRIFHYKIGGEW